MGHNKNYIRAILDEYCVIDTETTGLSFEYCDIIEIAILKVRNNIIIDKYSQLINPGYKIDEFITELTGITNEMIENQPSILDKKEEILNFIDNDVIVGHNTSFDINFLKKNLECDIQNKYIDTLQFSRKLYLN